MKKYLIIFLAVVAVVLSSCQPTETKEEKQLKLLKAIANRDAERPQYDPWDVGVKDVPATHGHLRIDLIEQWQEGKTEMCKVGVNLNINSGYADIRAISLVIDFDEECAELMPFNEKSIHSDLVFALNNKPGAMMSNIANGKFFFAFYCLAPMVINVSNGEQKLLELTFKRHIAPAFVNFDRTPGNVEFSMDGINNLILTLEDYEL